MLDITRAKLNKAKTTHRDIQDMLLAGAGSNWRSIGYQWRLALVHNLLRPVTKQEVTEALVPLGGYCPVCPKQDQLVEDKWTVTPYYAAHTHCVQGVPSLVDELHKDLSPNRAVVVSTATRTDLEGYCVDQAEYMLAKARGRCQGYTVINESNYGTYRYSIDRVPCPNKAAVTGRLNRPATYSAFGVQCPKCVALTRGEGLPKPANGGGGREYEPAERWRTLRLARIVYATRYRWLHRKYEGNWLASNYLGVGQYFPDWQAGNVWSINALALLGLDKL